MKTEIIKIHPEFPDATKILQCAQIIRKGGLVIFPTETVYGIAADFSNPDAMLKLREIKQRSPDKPFSVLISQTGLISNYTSMTDPKLYKLIDTFWPGPLTLVVPSKDEKTTIGVRMPDNAIALKLIQSAQCTIAAPSANIEGKKPPQTCEEALEDLDGLVDIAIDGGPAEIGQGSTVVNLASDELEILREGMITKDDIKKVIAKKQLLFVCTGNSCRSVMAHYLMKHMMRHREDVFVESAGTSVFINSTASRETISVLKDEGIDCVGHFSQPINTVLLKKSDLIFVMTRGHRQQVLERVPSVEKRVYLLKEFVAASTTAESLLDIPDPIGKPKEAYRECMLVIKDAIEKITKLI